MELGPTVAEMKQIIEEADEAFIKDLHKLEKGMLDVGVKLFSPGGSFLRRLFCFLEATETLYVLNGNFTKPVKSLNFPPIKSRLFYGYYRTLEQPYRDIIEDMRQRLGLNQKVVNLNEQ